VWNLQSADLHDINQANKEMKSKAKLTPNIFSLYATTTQQLDYIDKHPTLWTPSWWLSAMAKIMGTSCMDKSCLTNRLTSQNRSHSPYLSDAKQDPPVPSMPYPNSAPPSWHSDWQTATNSQAMIYFAFLLNNFYLLTWAAVHALPWFADSASGVGQPFLGAAGMVGKARYYHQKILPETLSSQTWTRQSLKSRSKT
jgi:hypothetical protein